jgi:hypothetical protein
VHIIRNPVFDSCVRLERLHLFDCYFTCTLAYGLWGMKLDLKSVFLEIHRLMRCVMINLGCKKKKKKKKKFKNHKLNFSLSNRTSLPGQAMSVRVKR